MPRHKQALPQLGRHLPFPQLCKEAKELISRLRSLDLPRIQNLQGLGKHKQTPQGALREPLWQFTHPLPTVDKDEHSQEEKDGQTSRALSTMLRPQSIHQGPI